MSENYVSRLSLASANYWLTQQIAFMERNGTNSAGYVIHYAPAIKAGQYTESDVLGIYAADKAHRDALLARVAKLTSRRSKVVR